MSFKSIIQDMKGELGSISRKGFDVKFSYGLRSRSHRVVSVTSPCHLTWVLVAVFIGFCMVLEFHLNGS